MYSFMWYFGSRHAYCVWGKKEMTGSETNAKSTGEEETVTIWHDGDEAIMGVIEDTVNKKIADENVSIKFEKRQG